MSESKGKLQVDVTRWVVSERVLRISDEDRARKKKERVNRLMWFPNLRYQKLRL